MKKIIAVFTAITMLLLCFTACSGTKTDDENEIKIFKTFETTDFDGEKVTENIFKGKKVTMVNIWATYCSPCIREMPDLNTLNETYADKGFQVIGVVCDVPMDTNGNPDEEKLSEAKKILEIRQAEYRNIFPFEEMNNTILSGNYSIPMTYFVDEDGQYLAYYLGSRNLEQWQQIVDTVLAQVEE